MITQELVNRYKAELEYLYDQGADFAKRFRGIATQLGLTGTDCGDPLVKQLLEGVAFLTAKLNQKVDAEFPKFTQHLLEVIAPELLAPIPSFAIVQFEPDFSDDALRSGYRLPYGETLRATQRQTRDTVRSSEECLFTLRQSVSLWPIRMKRAAYTQDLSPYRPFVRGLDDAKSALSLTLTAENNLRWCDLAIDELRLYADLSIQLLNHLLLNLHHPLCTFFLLDKEHGMASEPCLTQEFLSLSGFDEHESLLPVRRGFFSGLRFVQEYFYFPQKFRFIALKKLQSALKQMQSSTIELVFCFHDVMPSARVISGDDFKLFCAPVANVFKKSGKHIAIKPTEHEYFLSIDDTQSQDLELHSIIEVEGFRALGQPGEPIEPYYSHTLGFTDADQPAYTFRRSPRRLTELERQRTQRSVYVGSDVTLQLSVPQEAFPGTHYHSIAVKAWCTNRDLPLLIKIGQDGAEFHLNSNAPIRDVIHCVAGPTDPMSALTDRQSDWKLIAQLSPNFIGLREGDNEHALRQLKRLLSLYLPQGHHEQTNRSLVDGIVSFSTELAQRIDNTTLPPSLVRGVTVAVTLKLNCFDVHSMFLFGKVLSILLSRYTGLNSFTQLRVQSLPKHFDHTWLIQPGDKRWL